MTEEQEQQPEQDQEEPTTDRQWEQEMACVRESAATALKDQLHDVSPLVNLLVQTPESFKNNLRHVFARHNLPSLPAHGHAKPGIGEYTIHCIREGVRVAPGNDVTSLAMPHQLPIASTIGDDNRKRCRHVLQHGIA